MACILLFARAEHGLIRTVHQILRASSEQLRRSWLRITCAKDIPARYCGTHARVPGLWRPFFELSLTGNSRNRSSSHKEFPASPDNRSIALLAPFGKVTISIGQKPKVVTFR